jgi:hypothetical protein
VLLLQKVQMPQRFPQAPQLEPSLVVLTQAPEQQVLPVGHTFPQAPQLATLVAALTQAPTQQIPATPAVVMHGVGGVVAGVGIQVLLIQAAQAPHTLPHAPQL